MSALNGRMAKVQVILLVTDKGVKVSGANCSTEEEKEVLAEEVRSATLFEGAQVFQRQVATFTVPLLDTPAPTEIEADVKAVQVEMPPEVKAELEANKKARTYEEILRLQSLLANALPPGTYRVERGFTTFSIKRVD